MTKDELSGKIAGSVIAEIDRKFKGVLVQKMFFEMCHLFRKGESGGREPRIEFRAIVASRAEVERVIEKSVQNGESRESAVSTSEGGGEYDTEDWRNHVKFDFAEREFGIEDWDWSDKVEACEFSSFSKTGDFKFYDELWIDD